jgi:hypothetical protein
MNDQHWDIKDVYRNTTRDDMPMKETLTGLENSLIAAARITIKKNGGELVTKNDHGFYRIHTESPSNIEPLHTDAEQLAHLRKHFAPQFEKDLAAPGVARARAAYIALCIGESEKLKRESPAAWSAAINELQENYPAVVHNRFHSPEPLSNQYGQEAERAGLHDPKNFKLTERPLQD